MQCDQRNTSRSSPQSWGRPGGFPLRAPAGVEAGGTTAGGATSCEIRPTPGWTHRTVSWNSNAPEEHTQKSGAGQPRGFVEWTPGAGQSADPRRGKGSSVHRRGCTGWWPHGHNTPTPFRRPEPQTMGPKAEPGPWLGFGGHNPLSLGPHMHRVGSREALPQIPKGCPPDSAPAYLFPETGSVSTKQAEAGSENSRLPTLPRQDPGPGWPQQLCGPGQAFRSQAPQSVSAVTGTTCTVLGTPGDQMRADHEVQRRGSRTCPNSQLPATSPME